MQPENEIQSVEGTIQRIQAGDRDAVDQLIRLAYRRLHRIASRMIGRRYGRTPSLHATALINETVIRLYRQNHFSDLTCTQHFYARFSTATKHALIDHYRFRMAEKRGGNFHRLPLDMVLDQLLDQGVDPLELQDELDALRANDSRCADVVEMFYFGQMTVPEIARVLGLSISTVESDLRIGRAFLRRLALEGALV